MTKTWKKLSRFAMKLSLQQIPSPKKIIALDIGSSSTGVAVSCLNLQKAYFLKVIQCPIDSPLFNKKLNKIIYGQQHLCGIIVGKPFSTQQNKIILEKIQNLTKKMQKTSNANLVDDKNQLIYCFEDQNWTTKQAKQKIREIKQAVQYHGHIHGQKELQDGIAAMKILERFLGYYNISGNQ